MEYLELDTTVTQIKPQSKQVFIQRVTPLGMTNSVGHGRHPFYALHHRCQQKGCFYPPDHPGCPAILAHQKKGKPGDYHRGWCLGSEAGNALLKQGCKIHVIESFPRLLPRQMDNVGAGMLQAQLEKKGFSFYLGAKTRKITGKNQVDGIILDDDTRIKGDILLLSAGIRPTATLAHDLRVDIDRGVKVDDQLQTSLPDIYAAGDLIQHKNRMYGIWPAAEKQGEIAGLNMTGEKRIYPGTTPSNNLKVTGIDLFSTGDIDPEGQRKYFLQKDTDHFIYKKIVMEKNSIIGAILYGDTQGKNKILTAIQEKRDMSRHLQDLRTFHFEHI